jgi:predicted nucleic-acid-binding Zn-ribbon protein
MKRSKTCPKCGCNEIYCNEKSIIRSERSHITVSTWSKIFVMVYICAQCGYIEEYAEDLNSKGMANIKTHWKSVL